MQSNNLTRLTILHFIAVLFAMFNVNNIHSSLLSSAIPMLDIMIIYYFAVYKNNIFGVWFLFLLGILCDVLNGFPLGITSLIYIALVKFFNLINQKIATQESFGQILQQFVIFLFLSLIIKWLILSIYHLQLYNILPVLIQFIISCLAYMMMHNFFEYLSRKLIVNA